MLDDAAVVEASSKFVTIIIRRPHAYKFAADHEGASIPGIAFLDCEGVLSGNFAFGRDADAKALVSEMERQLK